jgi:hypothetical protein
VFDVAKYYTECLQTPRMPQVREAGSPLKALAARFGAIRDAHECYEGTQCVGRCAPSGIEVMATLVEDKPAGVLTFEQDECAALAVSITRDGDPVATVDPLGVYRVNSQANLSFMVLAEILAYAKERGWTR